MTGPPKPRDFAARGLGARWTRRLLVRLIACGNETVGSKEEGSDRYRVGVCSCAAAVAKVARADCKGVRTRRVPFGPSGCCDWCVRGLIQIEIARSAPGWRPAILSNAVAVASSAGR